MEAVARTSAAPGSAFIDRMIALVEGAERRKTPNELALSILLSGLTIVFPIVCATLWPLARYSGATLSLTVRIALLVCLIPTTIGGLLSASCGSAHDRIERVVDGPLRRTARRGRTGRTARQNHRRRLAPGPAPRRPDRTHFRKRSRWRNAPLCAARKHDADRPGAITRRMGPADARQIALGRDRPALDGYRGPRRNGKSIQACGQSSSTTGVDRRRRLDGHRGRRDVGRDRGRFGAYIRDLAGSPRPVPVPRLFGPGCVLRREFRPMDCDRRIRHLDFRYGAETSVRHHAGPRVFVASGFSCRRHHHGNPGGSCARAIAEHANASAIRAIAARILA